MEQRRKRINSSALTRSSHWRAATKPRAICAARNWINSTDISFSFSLSAKFSASYDRKIFRPTVCARSHPAVFYIYIYISFSLFYFRASIRRVLFPYPIYRPRNRVPILCERDGQLLPRLNTKFCRNYGKISGTESLENFFREIFSSDLGDSRQIFSSTR